MDLTILRANGSRFAQWSYPCPICDKIEECHHVLTRDALEHARTEALHELDAQARRARVQEDAEDKIKKLIKDRDRLVSAMEWLKTVGCMQSKEEEEFFCKKDGSAHSAYCPAGIAIEALSELTKI